MVTDPIHVHFSYNCPESKRVHGNTVGEHFKKTKNHCCFTASQKTTGNTFLFSNTSVFQPNSPFGIQVSSSPFNHMICLGKIDPTTFPSDFLILFLSTHRSGCCQRESVPACTPSSLSGHSEPNAPPQLRKTITIQILLGFAFTI